jgi:bifunctional non-homologous end joining protein LigD
MHLRGEAAVRRAQATPVTYLIFDLLWLDGHSLTVLRSPRVLGAFD